MIFKRIREYTHNNRTQYYIIRYGNFATNCNIKIMYGLISVVLGIDDYLSRGSTDCLVILIGSTSIWTIVELLLHTSETRVIKPMLFNVGEGTSIRVPLWLSLIVQGLQEGGLITTIGLYFGDRLEDTMSVIIFHVFLLLSLTNVCSQKSLTRSSKRMVNTDTSLGFIGCITSYDIYSSSFLDKDNFLRQLRMFLVMVYFSAWWTCATWWIGSRGVEVKDPVSNEVTSTKAATFFVLTYDVVFEIGFAYLIFYHLFIEPS